MSYRASYVLLPAGLCVLLAPLLSSCSTQSTRSTSQRPSPTGSAGHANATNTPTQPPRKVLIPPCHGHLRPAAASDVHSPSVPRSLYFGSILGDLYAVNAQTGLLRWCIHLGPAAGTPAIAGGVVYVCPSAGGIGTLYALNASDGAVRWHTRTDCGYVMPYGNIASPLVSNGVVYSGLYAVRAQDGQPLWKVSPTLAQQGIAFLALSNGAVYGSTGSAVYAFNAADGSMLWRYPSQASMEIGGPLVVSGTLLIVGTLQSVNQPETSALYAIDTTNGSLRWYFLLGNGYQGATILNNVIYVGSGALYALDAAGGKVLWRHQFNSPTSSPGLAVNGVLYINIDYDGAYALRSDTGSVLWHTPLRVVEKDNFLPSVVAGGDDYLASNYRGVGITVYRLNASTGQEYWQCKMLPQFSSLLAVA